jgi:heptosyltransferase II
MRALIIKIAPIGDTIMALPMVAALRCRHPTADITWICSETTADLVRLACEIEVIPVDEPKLFHGSVAEKASEVIKVWSKLRRRHFDLVAVGHTKQFLKVLTLTASVGQWRSFHPIRSKKRVWAVPGRYHGDEYVRLITGIDGPDAERAELPTVKLPLPHSLLLRLDGSTANLIVFAPGGANSPMLEQHVRRWPLQHYRQLAVELLKRGFRVAITGAPSDNFVRGAFADLSIIDLVSQTSVTELLALFGTCALVITHDSGPLHVAQLAGARTLALFGPTNPPEFVRDPTRVRVIWGGADLVCRPCYDKRHFAPCGDNRCVNEITVQEVLRAVEQMMTTVNGLRGTAATP